MKWPALPVASLTALIASEPFDARRLDYRQYYVCILTDVPATVTAVSVDQASRERRVLCKGPHMSDSYHAVTTFLVILQNQLGIIVEDCLAGNGNEILSKENWKMDVYENEVGCRPQASDSRRTSNASTLRDGMPGVY